MVRSLRCLRTSYRPNAGTDVASHRATRTTSRGFSLAIQWPERKRFHLWRRQSAPASREVMHSQV
jgi:hypothetical protein